VKLSLLNVFLINISRHSRVDVMSFHQLPCCSYFPLETNFIYCLFKSGNKVHQTVGLLWP